MIDAPAQVGLLNEQYHRNLDRFPRDFAFRLTPDESAALRDDNLIN